MTLQARGTAWSVALHGMILLAFFVLSRSVPVARRVMVVDFAFQNPASSPGDAPALLPREEGIPASRVPVVPMKDRRKQGTEVARVPQPSRLPPDEKPESSSMQPEEPLIAKADGEEVRNPSQPEPVARKILPEIAPLKQEIPLFSLGEEKHEMGKLATESHDSLQESGSVQRKGRADFPSPARGGPERTSAPRSSATKNGFPGTDQGNTGANGQAAVKEQAQANYVRGHFAYIRDRVNRSISYPSLARKMGWQGQVKVAFLVCEDGSVKDVTVVAGSGCGLLDRNAVETVSKVAPFPRPPVQAEIRMTITYKLN